MTATLAADSARGGIMRQIAQLCADAGVDNFIISPGSRSAPLTLALARQPGLRCRVVYDERSAGYIALGLAQQCGRPVGLVCTSGTAALNLAPAVAEAFYQQVPLLVFTADRPPEWIDQQDNQSIHQLRLYEPHCRGSFELPADVGHPDARWHALRTIAQAIELARGPLPGPVHVNAPLREPLYPAEGEREWEEGKPRQGAAERAAGWIEALPGLTQLTPEAWDRVMGAWQAAKRKVVVAGMHPADDDLRRALASLSRQPDVAVLADITANLYPAGTPLHHSDAILGTKRAELLREIQPDLAVGCGGPAVSKHLKQFLRRFAPQALWQVQAAGLAPDTYQGLTHVIPMRPAEFFAGLAERQASAAPAPSNSDYAGRWRQLEARAAALVTDYLESAPFGEFQAVYRVMQALPAGSRLQLGNSMPVRYANLIAHIPGVTLERIHSNRGVSGIDGVVSTAVGAALATDRLTTLITGDLAFFYDRNGLWHGHVPANLRIVLLNNHGGGIFDILDGPNRLPRPIQKTYFLTPQPLTAARSAADFGLDYLHCCDAAGLLAALPALFARRERGAILEIETDMTINTQVFERFKALLA